MSDDSLKPLEALVRKEAPGLLDKIPKQDRPKLFRLIHAQQNIEIKSFSGPVPSPEQMQQYENVLVGLSNRLVTVEKINRHTV